MSNRIFKTLCSMLKMMRPKEKKLSLLVLSSQSLHYLLDINYIRGYNLGPKREKNEKKNPTLRCHVFLGGRREILVLIHNIYLFIFSILVSF